MSIIGNYGGSNGSHSHEELVKRKEHCVCKQCGGELKTALVVYDIYGGAGEELYCPACDKQEFGVEREIYEMAEYYVENFQFNYFYDMEENDLNEQLNIGKVADMLSWMLKSIGLLDQDGIKNDNPDYELWKKRRRR
ncbi:MAG: hypothetical protein J6A10_09760 [Peptococcaceae bacterium]|nr:hypothetical protein [Peptococcaceae bacterium]MBO5430231.1 hypothetical protein [Peptococcaceae bacterium]